MSYSRQEIIIYAIIFVIIVAAVAIYASGVLASQTISVSVRLQQLNASQVTYPYELSWFRIYVNNTGNSAIKNLVIETYVNGLQLQTFTADLPAKSGTQINFSYDAYPINGTYHFQAIADPAHLLDIQNRSSASSTYSVNVSAPEVPDVYTSVSNLNISTTQHFSFLPSGLAAALYVSEQYPNQSLFTQMTNNNSKILYNTFRDLLVSGALNVTAGAYAKYKNSSVAYTAWVEGIGNLSYIEAIASTFGLPERNLTAAGEKTLYVKVNNETSFCAKYDRGWTKLFEYSNASRSPQTCVALASTTYNSTITSKTLNALTTDQQLDGYYYRNSTPIGFSVTTGNSTGVMEMVGNKYGVFTSFVRQNPATFNISTQNTVCAGAISSANNASVCTTILPAMNKSAIFVLTDSLAFSKNHTFTMYSLINATAEGSAEQSDAGLLAYLNISGLTQWRSAAPAYFTCGFPTTSIQCINPRNFTTNALTRNATIKLSIKNNLPNFIKLNKMGCTLGGPPLNTTLSTTVPSGGNTTVQIECPTFALPSLLPAYTISLNYTFNNAANSLSGYLNENG